MNDSTTQAPAFTPEQEALLRRLAAEAQAAEAETAPPGDPLAEAEGASVQSAGPQPRGSVVGRVLRDIGTGILEAPGQIARGGLEALDAAAQGLQSAATGLGLVSQEFADRNPATPVAPQIGPAEAQSVTGGIVNDVSQFAAGFLGASRILRGFGVLQGAGTGAAVARGMAAGAAADATVFEAHEQRLSDLVERYPALSNPVTRYLASDVNDTEAGGRLKNALEGLVIGGALEGLIASVRAVRAARRGDLEGAAQAADEAAQAVPPPRDPLVDEQAARQMDQEAQAELPLEGGRMNASAADPEQVIRDNPTSEPSANQPPRYEPRVLVDEAALQDIVTQYQREAGFGQDRNLSGIRTDLIESNLDLNQTLSAIRVAVQRQMDAVDPAGPVGRVQSLAEVRATANELAHEFAGDAGLFFQRLAGRADNDRALAAEVTAYRIFLTSVSDNTHRYAQALADTTGDAAAAMGGRAAVAEQYRKHIELLANTAALYRGVQTNIARALNAMRLPVQGNADLMRGIQDIETHAARFLMAKDTASRVRMAQGGWARRGLGALNEYFINSILSGPKTQAVNVISNFATTALQPAERMIAGAVSFNRQEFLEGGLQYLGLAQSFRDAVRLAARAAWNGDPILDPFRSTVELQGQAAISAQAFGMSGGAAATAVDFLGKVVRIPSRLLMTQDEFFKQLTYRSRITASAWREGLASGHSLGSREMRELVAQRMDGAFNPNGTAAHAEALAASRNVTFTDDLAAQTLTGNRTLGETLQSATTNHPMLQLIMPFVRTPTNIARFVWNRTPALNVLRTQYRNDLLGRNGSTAAALARAQMVTGAAMWGAGLTFALDGTITGGGPTDPTIRRQLEATGWRPYSIRTQNEDGSVTYRSFDRFDPFASFFAVAADVAEIGGFVGERDYDQLAMDMTVSLARQLSNKTYLSGLVRAMGALAEPDRRGEAFFRGLAGGFMPSFVNQTLRDDPHMREVRSIVDAIRARTPNSVDMDPVRNVLGEAVHVPPSYGPSWISPIARTTHAGGAQPMTREWRETVQDSVPDEIARQLVLHNASLRPPAPKLYGTVDLREWQHPETNRTAFDRYQALVGEVEIGGQTLRERLSDLIQSREYREVATDGTYDLDGSRIDLIRRVVGHYRNAAEQRLRREMPDLDRALFAAQRQQQLIRVQ